MTRRTILAIAIPLLLVAAGCGGTKTVALDQRAADDVRPPDWYLDTPQEDDFVLATATSTSRDVQVAVDKATLQAREELAKQLDLRLRAIESQFEEETGFQDDAELKTAYKSAVNVAVEKTLTGSRTRSKHVVREGELWRAYVLQELPMAPVREALVEEVRSDPALTEKFATAETFKEIGG